MSDLARLYAIVDAGCFADEKALFAFFEELMAAGVTLFQYRNKTGNARQMLSHARELVRIGGQRAAIIMNDRADLCLAADCGGVHVGQDDLSPAAARRIVGPARFVGISTHNPEQVAEADKVRELDYIAVGPVFATTSKANPDPVIGLEGVRRARELTRKPLVAIGGITRENAAEVRTAGADVLAVISDLLREPRRAAEEFLHKR